MKKYIFLPLFLFSLSSLANTVSIFADGEAGPVKTGYGFFITKNLVVTTFKAAEKSPKILVSFNEDPKSEKVPVQAVVKYSPLHDIVVLQVAAQEKATPLILAKDIPTVGSKLGSVEVVKVTNSMFPKMYVTGTAFREGAHLVGALGVVAGVLTAFDSKLNQTVVTPGKSIRDIYAAPAAAMNPEDFYKAASTNTPDLRSPELLKVCEKGISVLQADDCADMAEIAAEFKIFDTQLELLSAGCLRGHNGLVCGKALKSHVAAFKWDQIEPLAKEYCKLGSKPACLVYMKELLAKKKETELVEFATPLCTQRDGDACTMLGRLKESKDDFDLAERYYLKGCEFKSGYGCSGASGIYFSQKKYDLERKFLTEGCNLKDGYSCFGLGILAAEAKNHDEKIEYYKKGCSYEYGPSCHQLFNLKLQSGEKNRHELVQEYLFPACAQQNVASCEEVGQFFLEKSQAKEALAVTKGWCDSNNPKLCVVASKAAEVLKDETARQFALDTAMNAFEAACAKDDQEACKWKAQLQASKPLEKNEKRAPASDSKVPDLQ